MKNRSLPAQLFAGLLLAIVALPLTACNFNIIYREPAANYAGRPIPPSGLLERVMAAYTINGSQGGLEILDGLRDLRSNVQNTVPAFSIKGFSAGYPISIINYPEQTTGYVLSYTDGSVINVDYSTETTSGSAAAFGADTPSVAATPAASLFAGAAETAGVLGVAGQFGSVSLNLPNVNKVVINTSGTIILAMVRNSNQLYRVVKLPSTNNPVYPPGYVDCEPLLLPAYCVVPVGNAASSTNSADVYDHPVNAIFSADGTSVYILNCGPECGGTTAGVTVLQQSPLLMQTIPTVAPLSQPAPLQNIAVANPIAVPGGVTAGITDGSTLYLAGQQLGSNGLFAGNLSQLNLSNYALGTTYSISDGNHTKMLFADNGTLWIGASQCDNGQRAANAATLAIKDQSANTNCLSRFVPKFQYNAQTNPTPQSILPAWVAKVAYQPGQKVCDAPTTTPGGNVVCDGGNVQVVLTGGTSAGSTPTFNQTLDQTTTDGTVTWINLGATTPVQIIPMISPNDNVSTTTNGVTTQAPVVPVLYPNTNLFSSYYGTLYGECWVQNFGKIYTSYGGQIHAFNTADGFEINNYNITIQGTVLDVAYIDAESNSAN